MCAAAVEGEGVRWSTKVDERDKRTFLGEEITQKRQPEGEHIALARPEGLIHYAQGAAVAGVATTRRGDHGGVGVDGLDDGGGG